MLGERLFCREIDLQGPDDPDSVAAVDCLAVDRIHFLEIGSQVVQAFIAGFFLQFLAECGIALSSREKTIDESLQVEASASDNEGELLFFQDHICGLNGQVDKVCGCKLSRGIRNIQEMMRDIVSFIWGDFICPDIKAFVDLHGIAVDDFAPEFSGEFDRGRTFSNPSGPQDDDQIFSFIMQF